MVTFEQVELFYRAAFLKATNPDSYAEYYDGSYHRPHWKAGGAIAPKLAASYRTTSLLNVTPRKGREYTEMELPIDYTRFDALATTQSMPKFICITMKPGAYPFYIYGWIDSVEPIATKGPRQNTLIRWHVDYWLTISAFNYLRNANPAQYGSRYAVTFANGRVKRGPADMARPDPSAPRKWIYKSSTALNSLHSESGDWVVMLISANAGTWSSNRLVFFRPGQSIPNTGLCPTTQDVFSGNIITLVGATSDKIIGAWFSPVPPWPTLNCPTNNSGGKYWYETTYIGTSSVETFYSITETTTSDENRVIITDQLTNTIATLPWGITFDYIKVKVDVGANGAQLILGFVKYDPNDPLSLYAPVETDGRLVSMPLAAIPMYGNAMSDYIYSGQRQYEIENAKNQREQAMWSGIANIGNNAIGGAIGGSMVAPGAGTAVGAIAGLATGFAGVGINAAITTHYDIKSQEATDRLVSNQAGTVVQFGGGDYAIQANYRARIVVMERDSVSLAELQGEQAELGYVTDAFTTNAGTLIDAGGPLRIEGLQVDGDITPAGRANIQALFARGVHLDLIT